MGAIHTRIELASSVVIAGRTSTHTSAVTIAVHTRVGFIHQVGVVGSCSCVGTTKCSSVSITVHTGIGLVHHIGVVRPGIGRAKTRCVQVRVTISIGPTNLHLGIVWTRTTFILILVGSTSTAGQALTCSFEVRHSLCGKDGCSVIFGACMMNLMNRNCCVHN